MREGFPEKFRPQHIGVAAAVALSELPPVAIARYFSEHPDVAQQLLTESYDKRYSPSSFIREIKGGFEVGWWSCERRYEWVKTFSKLADAATDYLLFSLGKGRWLDPRHPD